MKPGMRADKLHVAHIADAGGRILEYTAGMTEEDFALDQLRRDAVIRNFQVIGEAAKRLSVEIRSRHPDVPWTEFAKFRDVLIHRYDEIAPAEVWRILQDELPPALTALQGAMRKEGWI